MDGSGLSNGGSLTEMNATYARRIKRIQLALLDGITNLVNVFILNDGLNDYIGNFTLKMTPIITIEDNRRDELLQNKIRNVNDIMALLQNLEQVDDDTKLKMLTTWLSKYLNQQDIVEILDERIKELEQEEKEEKEDDFAGDEDGTADEEDTSIGRISRPSPIRNSEPERNEPPTPENNEETNTPEIADQIDLTSIEGEDLV